MLARYFLLPRCASRGIAEPNRNRRVSDDPQEGQHDRHTQPVAFSLSSFSLLRM